MRVGWQNKFHCVRTLCVIVEETATRITFIIVSFLFFFGLVLVGGEEVTIGKRWKRYDK